MLTQNKVHMKSGWSNIGFGGNFSRIKNQLNVWETTNRRILEWSWGQSKTVTVTMTTEVQRHRRPHQSSTKVKPEHLHRPLVVDCSTAARATSSINTEATFSLLVKCFFFLFNIYILWEMESFTNEIFFGTKNVEFILRYLGNVRFLVSIDWKGKDKTDGRSSDGGEEKWREKWSCCFTLLMSLRVNRTD